MQARLFKSLKLWSFYVDLEESLGTVESTKAVYDKILELRIANAQIIVNYAAFLEENKYFEESFKVSGNFDFLYNISFTRSIGIRTWCRGLHVPSILRNLEYILGQVREAICKISIKLSRHDLTTVHREVRRSNVQGTFSNKHWRSVRPNHANQYS